MSQHLKTSEVAKCLAVDIGKVTAWIRSGELPAVNVSKKPTGQPRWRVSADDLERFILRRMKSTDPPKRRGPRVKRVYT